MKFLAGFIASLLTSLVFTACVSVAFNKTIANPEYLQKTAKETKVFDEASALMAKQLANQAGMGSASKEIETMVKSVLTPGYLEAKANDFLAQFKQRYEGDGPIPSLNLADLAVEAKKHGIEIPEGQIQTSIAIPADVDADLKQTFTVSRNVEFYSFIAIGVLFLVLFLLCVATHNYWHLVSLFATSAIMQLVMYVLMLKGPDFLLVRFTVTQGDGNEFVALAEKFVKVITNDLAAQFLTFVAILSGAALISFGFALVSKARHRKTPTPQPQAMPAVQNSLA